MHIQDWEANFFTWWGTSEPRVVYHRMTAGTKIALPFSMHFFLIEMFGFSCVDNTAKDCDLASFPNLKLWAQPGGNAYDQQNSLGPAGKANILKFIQRKNSTYLGTCAGYYLTATDYWWQDQYYQWLLNIITFQNFSELLFIFVFGLGPTCLEYFLR